MTSHDDTDDEIRFSRSGTSCPLGKCTDEVKVLVPEVLKEELTALAVLNGQCLSEYVRDVLLGHTRGHIYRLRAAAGNGIPGEGRE